MKPGRFQRLSGLSRRHDVGIMGFVTRNASPQNKLRGGVEFIDKIPISTSGKIIRDRRLLKEKE